MKSIFKNARIFTAQANKPQIFEQGALLISDGVIEHVGNATDPEIAAASSQDVEVIDVSGRTIVPSFFDGFVVPLTQLSGEC